MIRLQCLHGVHENRVFEFDRSSIVIGRGQECDLRVDDSTCSHRHAKVEERDNTFTVTDLDSTNGMLVNGKRSKHSEVRYGDRLAALHLEPARRVADRPAPAPARLRHERPVITLPIKTLHVAK